MFDFSKALKIDYQDILINPTLAGNEWFGNSHQGKQKCINLSNYYSEVLDRDELKNISSGENFIKWNGMTNDGLKLSSAVYIVSIANRTKVYNQKILFLK